MDKLIAIHMDINMYQIYNHISPMAQYRANSLADLCRFRVQLTGLPIIARKHIRKYPEDETQTTARTGQCAVNLCQMVDHTQRNTKPAHRSPVTLHTR